MNVIEKNIRPCRRAFLHVAGVLCLAAILLASMTACRDNDEGIAQRRSYYARLDSALTQMEDNEANLRVRLGGMKQEARTKSGGELYFYYKQIANSYTYYIPDSALVYIGRCSSVADESGRADWKAEAEIMRSKILVLTGMLTDARNTLDAIGRMPLTESMRKDYYVEEINYWNDFAIYQNKPRPTTESMLYADSLLMLADSPTSPYNIYGRLFAEPLGKGDSFLADLMTFVDNMNHDNEWYWRLALYAGVMAGTHDGMRNESLKYYVDGLCCEARNVSNHMLMLPSVASMALADGELEYATRFYNATVSVQQDFPQRVHNSNGGLQASLMHYHDYMMESVTADRRISNVLLVVVSMLAIVAVVSAVYNIMQFRRKSALNRELQTSMEQLEGSHAAMQQLIDELKKKDGELNDRNRELEQYNVQLNEANYVKEEYIGSMFATCSEYLEKISKLKLLINRKLKTGLYEDCLRLTDSVDVRANGDLQDLWARFDDVFLNLFPDFVNQFNTLLQPDKRIVMRNGERMNTDLRIYALIRLGINSSVKIGRILGISSQTVYNATMKMRSRAANPDEDFSASVRNLKGIDTQS